MSDGGEKALTIVILLTCGRMLLESGAIVAKKLLVNDKNNGLCQRNMSPDCCSQCRIEKHCLVKHFAFLRKEMNVINFSNFGERSR